MDIVKAGSQPEVENGLGIVGQASLRLPKHLCSRHHGKSVKKFKSTTVFGLNSK